MSYKKIKQVKDSSAFKTWDLIIYGIILAAVIVFFVCFFLMRDLRPLKGIGIYCNNVQIFTYSFESDEYEIFDSAQISVENEDDKGIKIKFKCADGRGENIIYIDKKEASADVTESNCSLRKDCTHMSKITNNGGAIYCSPHKLKIIPTGYAPVDGDIII